MGREERREGFNTKVAKGTEDTKRREEKNSRSGRRENGGHREEPRKKRETRDSTQRRRVRRASQRRKKRPDPFDKLRVWADEERDSAAHEGACLRGGRASDRMSG